MSDYLTADHFGRKIEGSFEIEPISFEMMPGTICGVIGENGAGKTTLMKMMMQLYQHTSGSIKLGSNLNINALTAYIPDVIPYPLHMTLQEIVTLESLLIPTWNQTVFDKYRIQFNLKLMMPLNKLSLGEKQRLMFAIALASEANLYILDEPTEGIDPFERDEFIRLLHGNIYKHEAIALISTHNVKGVENLLDYILYMEKGNSVLFTDIEQFPEEARKCLLERQLDTRLFDKNPSLTQFIQMMQGCSA
ncbi:ABC transporter ATP-binding protein [Erysipelothrix sp. strain 2 (EsS2-7-Brazil)]|uniref:ATP-binding cassette domain-containing protein n=1 Tax=Erysipelothrix sp. strain 2 (EsS2-7-Brazil) TaxID=2500579 RepID=UPI001909F4AE|nr:ABC transporter ATP-binding protein [Erysipelothrix sp. strain 2 (EsS2-7-Brazil)]MBK2403664.1 ABC transporter ATP-binding protein [Erysipelothrix sp. strain 2 (EsS2-7-Brazil)]